MADLGDGNDSATGGLGNDTMSGAGGNDSLSGDAGADTLLGGAGRDTLVAKGNDSVDGGKTGDDWDTLRVAAGAIVTYCGGTNEAGTITWPAGDTITFTGIEQIHIGGIVAGSGGNDVIGAGYADPQGDQIDGVDRDADVVSAGNGDDAVQSGAGNDTVSAGAGRDSVVGGAGDDTLFGDAGNDTLSGGTGGDNLFGGDGNDRLGGGSAADADDLRRGFGNDAAYGGGGDDRLFGDAGNGSLFGGEGGDTHDGGDGADTVEGGAGADLIDGNEGDDLLKGGDGNDTIESGAGNDRVHGGSNDDYADDRSTGADMVSDFGMTLVDDQTADQLDVSDLQKPDGTPICWSDVVVSDDGNGNTVLTFPEGERITLEGVDPATVDKQMAAKMGIPCLSAGTLIDTPSGRRRVEDLRAGDLVTTPDGALPVVWTAGQTFGAVELARFPSLRPVLIRRGA
jgi:Ca2+-binding RTX toxin-like protein